MRGLCEERFGGSERGVQAETRWKENNNRRHPHPGLMDKEETNNAADGELAGT